MKKLLGSAFWVNLCLLFSFCHAAQAQQTINLMANEFASEAGTIGGTVKACGENTTEYTSRVISAINVFAKTPHDSQEALTAYENALLKAQELQSQHHAIECVKALKDFSHLPLMQNDYKEKVLPALAKMVASSSGNTNASPEASKMPSTAAPTEAGKNAS